MLDTRRFGDLRRTYFLGVLATTAARALLLATATCNSCMSRRTCSLPLYLPVGHAASIFFFFDIFLNLAVKIQTSSPGMPLLVYPKCKCFRTMIHPHNVSTPLNGYQRLYDLISTAGHAGSPLLSGRKGYFSAALLCGGTELHVYASTLLPAQSW